MPHQAIQETAPPIDAFISPIAPLAAQNVGAVGIDEHDTPQEVPKSKSSAG